MHVTARRRATLAAGIASEKAIFVNVYFLLRVNPRIRRVAAVETAQGGATIGLGIGTLITNILVFVLEFYFIEGDNLNRLTSSLNNNHS